MVAWLVVSAAMASPGFCAATPRLADGCEPIREAIRALPPSGGVVPIGPGVYDCSSPVAVESDNVELRGAGADRTVLRLADGAESPVLVVGSLQAVLVPPRVAHVVVRDLTVDGNKAHQDTSHECGHHGCAGDSTSIRNNGITVRAASDVTIENVRVHDALSGGLTTEKRSDHLVVRGLEADHNYFDGLSGDDTRQSLFEDLYLHDNRMAGLTMDLDFDDNHIDRARVQGNGDVGVFVLHSSGNLFEHMRIDGSGKDGIFIAAAVRSDASTCASGNEFRDLVVRGSRRDGVHLDDVCPGDSVTGHSTISGSGRRCVYEYPGSRLAADASSICR